MVGNLAGKRKEEFTVLEEVVARVVPQAVSQLGVLGRAVLQAREAVRREARRRRAVPRASGPLWRIPAGRCISRRREAV